jgi:hypothetical protein
MFRGSPARRNGAAGRPALVARVQLAVQDTVGALLVPFHDPRRPKVAPAAARLLL